MTNRSVDWYLEKSDWIRQEAGHDVAKFEALVLDPAIEREARDRFPDEPNLYLLLRTILEGEILLAKGGIFLIDGPPTDDQIAELQRRNREKLAKWTSRRRRR